MTLQDIIDLISKNPEFWIVVFLGLVEVAPIKVNPWSKLIKWIGEKLNGELYKKFDALEQEIKTVEREFEIKNANDKRWDILDFANSCRNGRKHGREEWEHVIDQLKAYETYVNEHKIDNGVIEEETKYLRALYQERCKKNDFI